MSDSQDVDADHNESVKDNDLTNEHDFILGPLGAEETPTVRGAWMSFPLADITAKHSSICRRISMLFRQQIRHATTPNTTTSKTDVPCYRTAIITTPLEVDESALISLQFVRCPVA